MSTIRLIAGLGNPGKKHERDRHNVGFWFVSRLAAQHRIDLRAEPKFHGLLGKIGQPQGEIWLVMPQTYMNLSGKSVGALARFYKIQPEECLVVHDELDFLPGVAKLKQGGGVAGHNGLKDIAAQLGTQGFWRLRLGIGHPGDKNMVADYVLSSPPVPERELIDLALMRSLEVSPLLLAGEMHAAMLKLHTAKPEPGADGKGSTPPVSPV
jgi:PTH1 family peptidyl-tRNA hydrolase